MLRTTSVRAVPYLLLLVPALVGCSSVAHEVGSDAADSSVSECTTRAGIVCNAPTVPEGCTLSASTCSDDLIHCGQLICPPSGDGSSACSNEDAVCETPDLSPGCTVGPNTCVGGSIHCGEVTCPENAADAGNCAGQPAPPCSPPPSGCNWVGPLCQSDRLTCGTLVCSDAGADASTAIACGSTTCNAATEYCDITPACIEAPDGATNAKSVCTPIPSNCANSNTCQCILNGILSEHGPDSASVVPEGAGCAVTENCA
jgi:hypothetical protein